MKGSIETRVKAVIARYFNLPPSKVVLDAAFVGDLGGDPLDLIGGIRGTDPCDTLGD